MAIFKDENDQLYIGTLYIKNNGLFSGNFLKISNRVFQLIRACNRIIRTCLIAIILASFCVFAYKMIFGKSDEIGMIFAIFFLIKPIIAVIYFVLFPLMLLLFRNKAALEKVKMRCLSDESVEIYSIVFLMALAMSLAGFLSGFIDIQRDAFLLLITFLPILVFSGLATFYYSKHAGK